MPGTFSRITARGWIIATKSTYLLNSVFRRSSLFRNPANEKPWHGGPPATTSTLRASALISTAWLAMSFDMSCGRRSSHDGHSKRIDSGPSMRFASNVANASTAFSTANRPLNPDWARPRDNPPQPAKRSIKFKTRRLLPITSDTPIRARTGFATTMRIGSTGGEERETIPVGLKVIRRDEATSSAIVRGTQAHQVSRRVPRTRAWLCQLRWSRRGETEASARRISLNSRP